MISKVLLVKGGVEKAVETTQLTLDIITHT